MKKKVLTLTIDKQWFEMVVSGEKKEDIVLLKVIGQNDFF